MDFLFQTLQKRRQFCSNQNNILCPQTCATGPLIAVLLALAMARVAAAQGDVGTRAAGMAGAFVAVADDATAVYWNPAGMATGSLVSVVLDYGQGASDWAQRRRQALRNEEDTGAFVGPVRHRDSDLPITASAAYGTSS